VTQSVRSNNKEKRKAHRKSLRKAELIAGLKAKRTLEKWIKDWYESRPDYPVTNQKRKPLTWSQIRKFIKNKNR